MNIDLTADEAAFRDEVRRFFRDAYPADLRHKQDNGVDLSPDERIRWQRILNDRGWFAVNWPVEYGGTGWSPVQKYLFDKEMAAANAPWIVPFGVKMVGPIIYTFGNDAQKERFLPDILESRVWWCQGYSEPGAGSDLAALRTTAVRDGDHYVVNGTKTWTTLAQFADWIFCLVRTDSEVERKQEGISFLLIDLGTPGVSIRPIVTLEGGHEVNEVHFDDVRVPTANLVGEEGRGWSYGKILLEHERSNIAGVHASQYRLESLRSAIGDGPEGGQPLAGDRRFLRKLAALDIELTALEFTELRTLASVATGAAPGPESSILKICGTEIQQAIDALLMEAAGYYALPFVPEQYEPGYDVGSRIGGGNETQTALRYFNNRKVTIYGGSNEIQKNIVARRVLGL